MALTANQLSHAIDRTVMVQFESLLIECKVIDAKNTWGREKLLIRPTGGSGEQWIECSRLRQSGVAPCSMVLR